MVIIAQPCEYTRKTTESYTLKRYILRSVDPSNKQYNTGCSLLCCIWKQISVQAVEWGNASSHGSFLQPAEHLEAWIWDAGAVCCPPVSKLILSTWQSGAVGIWRHFVQSLLKAQICCCLFSIPFGSMADALCLRELPGQDQRDFLNPPLIVFYFITACPHVLTR